VDVRLIDRLALLDQAFRDQGCHRLRRSIRAAGERIGQWVNIVVAALPQQAG
jgi:hypothetical protein